MFGAAGAPVTALGDFRLDPMSTASALLSSIAPAAPATPQGSAAVDASAFEGLLASMMDGDMTGSGEGEAALSTEKTDITDEALVGTAVPAQTLPPAPQPILLIPEAEVTIEASVTDDAVEAAPAETAPVIAAPAPAATPASVIAAPVAAAPATDAEAPAVSPLPTDKTPAGKTVDTDPQVRPAVKADGADDAQVQPLAPTPADAKAALVTPLTQPPVTPEIRPVADDTRRTRQTIAAAERMATPNLRQVQLVDGELVEGAQPTSAAADASLSAPETLPPAPVLADKAAARPQVQPPIPAEAEKAAVAAQDATTKAETPDLTKAIAAPVPNTDRKVVEESRPIDGPTLRALAERASRPVETNAAVDTAAPSSPAPAATASATPATAAQPAPADATAPRPEIAAPVETVAEATDPTGDAPIEATAPDAAPSAQTAHAAREAAAPAMSRVAVEATAQIAAQIQRRLEGRSTRFEMSLTPDELGRVDVKLDIDSEGRLAARLAFDNPAAAADLKGRADELRRQLEQQGFHVADDAFEFSQRDSGSSAFDRGQDTRQDQSRAFAAASRLNADADAVAQPPRWTALSLTPAGVDMKV